MTVNTHIAVAGGTGLIPVCAGLRRVEKARQTSDLGDEAMQDRGRNRQGDGRLAVPQPLSHSETGAHDALWYGTVLRPAFVAQVLGQVTAAPARRDARSALSAYEEGPRPFAAPALDRRI
jgi:hypothetical protein